MSVGNNIQAIRKNKGLTQKALAEKLGITQSALSLMEKNAHRATLQSLARIASALEVSLLDLIADNAEDTPGYPLDNSEIRNYKQSEWLRLYDLLNAAGIDKASKYIKQISQEEQYQSEQYKEFLKIVGGYSIRTGIKPPKTD